MQCVSCSSVAIILQPARCREHFIEYFEAKVKSTIEHHHLIPNGARVAVAVSGGKDSLTVLQLLKKFGYDVTAVAIDEGIAGYREHTLDDACAMCEKNNIPLVIHSFVESTSKTLDTALREGAVHPCTVCGKERRKLLNTAAQGFDVLATGHNADDESQAVLMNIIKGNTELFSRIGPVSGERPQPGLTRRVKPLYFCTEKEIMVYAHLHGLVTRFVECPYASQSYRGLMRDALNSYAEKHPGVKTRLLDRFLKAKSTGRS